MLDVVSIKMNATESPDFIVGDGWRELGVPSPIPSDH
jgi:hypothetical protein